MVKHGGVLSAVLILGLVGTTVATAVQEWIVRVMTDYIKREDAIKAFDPKQRQDWYTPWIVETLEDLPSVDVEPVVRCKDCEWYVRVDKRRFYRGMDCLQKHIDTIVPDRDFCSKAERRGKQDG